MEVFVGEEGELFALEVGGEDAFGEAAGGFSAGAEVAAAVADVDPVGAGVGEVGHGSAFAMGGCGFAGGAGEGALQLEYLGGSGEGVGAEFEVTEAGSAEQWADEAVETVAEDCDGHLVVIQHLDEIEETGVELDGIEEAVDLGVGYSDDGELSGEAFSGADCAFLPALFDAFPGVVDGEALDQFVQNILLGDGAVEVDPDAGVGWRGNE